MGRINIGIRKLLIWLTINILIFFNLAPAVSAQENTRSSDVTTLGKGEVINRDYFAADKKVVLSGTVNGDAYLAGKDILVDGTVNGDLLVAGGDVNISGEVAGNIRAAGGSIYISGKTGKNLTIMGGSVHISDSANVSGSLAGASGSLQIYSPIGKEANIAAGTLVLGSNVGKDFSVIGGDITLSSQAKVNGNVTYLSRKQADISPAAVISGQVTHNLPPSRLSEKKQETKTFLSNFRLSVIALNFLSSLVVGLIFIWLAPNLTRKTVDLISSRPLPSLGVGFGTLILAPIAALLMVITLIGIPLGLLVLLAYFFDIFLVKLFISIFIGERLVTLIKQRTSLYFMFFIGLIIYTLLTALPKLGFFISLLGILFGLGAFIMAKYLFITSLRLRKTI